MVVMIRGGSRSNDCVMVMVAEVVMVAVVVMVHTITTICPPDIKYFVNLLIFFIYFPIHVAMAIVQLAVVVMVAMVVICVVPMVEMAVVYNFTWVDVM